MTTPMCRFEYSIKYNLFPINLVLNLKYLDPQNLLSHAKREERVIDLSLEVGATTYISGNGARVYQDESHFNEKRIKIRIYGLFSY